MKEKQLKEAKMCPCCESTAKDCTCAPTCKSCDCNKDKVSEGLADLADMAERDHEVQMARAELYKIAKYAIKLHDMLKGVSEETGLEGWVQAKITKAAEGIGSVYHHLDYDTKFPQEAVSERKMSKSEKSKETSLKNKYDDSSMKKNMQKQYGKDKGKDVYFATIRKQAMESNDPYKLSIAEKLNKKLKGE